ncbi:MAG TPA: hypothetical protein VK700_10690 [Steroidobacteraceae bacterium]|nr:hypothetical protein [Steroidobacteraceae bacterium]
MMRWLRLAAVAIYANPTQLVTLVVMVCAWCAAAEIYWVALQVPHHGESATLVLIVMDLVYSWSLVFSVRELLQVLEELRIPQLRPLRAAALCLILALVFIAPCAFIGSLGAPARDVLLIAMGSLAGSGGALLWHGGSRTRKVPGVRLSAAARSAADPAQVPRPWRAMRLALGPPYATTSWKRRVLELAVLCAVLGGAPLLVVSFENSLSPRGFPILLHIAEAMSFVVAIGLCWLGPLSRVVGLFVSQSEALAELALLPGQGGGRQQLRRLCLVALSVPVGALLVLLALALSLLELEHQPLAAYVKVTAVFVLIPLLTLPVLANRLTKPRAPNPWAGALVMYSQTWWWLWIAWNVNPARWQGLPALFRWVAWAVVAGGVTFLVGLTIHSLRKLARRPHPFVEVSS